MSANAENTAFVYLYRDADNYKKWGEVIVEGACRPEYEEAIRAACQRREVFVADPVRVPEIFLFDEEGWEATAADHGFHEFWGLRATEEAVDDRWERGIEEFVEEFRAVGENGWEVGRAFWSL